MKRLSTASAALVLLLGLIGCGDSGRIDGGAAARPVSDRQAILRLYTRYTAAIEAGHYRSVCQMSSKGFREELTRMIHNQGTCEMAVGGTTRQGKSPQVPLTRIDISGKSATGRVGPNTWKFARMHGVWKVAHAD